MGKLKSSEADGEKNQSVEWDDEKPLNFLALLVVPHRIDFLAGIICNWKIFAWRDMKIVLKNFSCEIVCLAFEAFKDIQVSFQVWDCSKVMWHVEWIRNLYSFKIPTCNLTDEFSPLIKYFLIKFYFLVKFSAKISLTQNSPDSFRSCAADFFIDPFSRSELFAQFILSDQSLSLVVTKEICGYEFFHFKHFFSYFSIINWNAIYFCFEGT